MLFNLLRSQAFRIVLVYIVLFALSVAALLAFTYWNTRRTLDTETDQIIAAEITGLSEEYKQLGLRGLVETVVNRSSQHGLLGLYLLSDMAKRPIAGNLDAWPPAITDAGEFVEFDYQRPVNGKLETHRARGRVFALAGGFQLLVAQDVHDRDLNTRLFTITLPWTVGLILLLGLGGGALLSRNMLARLDSINRTSSEIFAGDLTRRVPLSRAHDEFDILAENLNLMLDRIERLMKGLREVTDSVAHDLRTPLGRLRNRLEESLAHLNAGKTDIAGIEAAIAETDRLIGTFNALLLIAETDAGAARGAMSPLDLSSVADGVIELYEPFAEEKKVTLKLVPAGVALIEGNRSLITQALANLVDNAIKYTPPGGAVMVRAAIHSSGVELSVCDTGPGIPECDRARVVERFVRLETSRNSPGTGLGLSLVAAVAHFHNAQLLLSDNAPGLKATICFPKPGSRASLPAPARPASTNPEIARQESAKQDAAA